MLHNAAQQEYYERVLDVANRAAAESAPPPGGASASGGGGGGAGARHGAVSPDDLLGQIAGDMDRTAARHGGRVARRGAILVCAQSNGAIDELVARLLAVRFVDECGAEARTAPGWPLAPPPAPR